MPIAKKRLFGGDGDVNAKAPSKATQNGICIAPKELERKLNSTYMVHMVSLRIGVAPKLEGVLVFQFALVCSACMGLQRGGDSGRDNSPAAQYRALCENRRARKKTDKNNAQHGFAFQKCERKNKNLKLSVELCIRSSVFPPGSLPVSAP